MSPDPVTARSDLDDVPIGALVGRLIDDGKRFARAEVAVQVATVRTRIDNSKSAVVMVVVALLLVIAAVVVLVAAFGIFLGRWLTPAGGLAVSAIVALVVAGVLGKTAAGRISSAATEPVA